LAFGQQVPTQGEQASSWALWAGTHTVIGDSNWGKIQLTAGSYGASSVYDLIQTGIKIFTLTENRYGTGQGATTPQLRGSNTPFLAADVTPSWENYTAPMAKNWRYVQVRLQE
jgi:hypothetical protein